MRSHSSICNMSLPCLAHSKVRAITLNWSSWDTKKKKHLIIQFEPGGFSSCVYFHSPCCSYPFHTSTPQPARPPLPHSQIFSFVEATISTDTHVLTLTTDASRLSRASRTATLKSRNHPRALHSNTQYAPLAPSMPLKHHFRHSIDVYTIFSCIMCRNTKYQRLAHDYVLFHACRNARLFMQHKYWSAHTSVTRYTIIGHYNSVYLPTLCYVFHVIFPLSSHFSLLCFYFTIHSSSPLLFVIFFPFPFDVNTIDAPFFDLMH